MRLPSIPGPGDVLNAVEGLREGVSDALALVPRIGAVVGRVEELLGRVTTVIGRVEVAVGRAEAALTALEATRDRADRAIEEVGDTRRRADDAIERLGGTQQHADDAIAAVAGTRAKADEAITAVGRTTARADDALGRAEGLVGRMEPVVDGYAEPLRQLAPSLRRFAETMDPHEVEALVTLIDRLPTLVTHLDEDVLPVLQTLEGVAPDVHALLDTVQDLREVVKGFPGSKLFRRRGREEIAQEESDGVGPAAEA
ncbi:hypothetical protein [Geodermatophilus sp. SYSU D00815]